MSTLDEINEDWQINGLAPTWAKLQQAAQEQAALVAENKRLVDEVQAARQEISEQARVCGMGAEREARLMAENAELRRLAAVGADCAPYLKEGETPAERIKRVLGDAESLLDLYRDVMAERDALKAENALLEEVNAQLREQNDAVGKACAKYEAELERIKALPPVAWGWMKDGVVYDCISPKEHAKNPGAYTTPLFALTKDLT